MSTRKTFTLVSGVALLLASFVGSCTSERFAPPPYIPSEYYDCLETYPIELISAYFAGYGEIWGPKEKYDGKVFVFKNILIEQWVTQDLDKGLIRLGSIKCYLAKQNGMDGYKTGDLVDVVGLNLGPEDIKVTGLTFKDCYVLPHGVLQLPADGNGPIVGGY